MPDGRPGLKCGAGAEGAGRWKTRYSKHTVESASLFNERAIQDSDERHCIYNRWGWGSCARIALGLGADTDPFGGKSYYHKRRALKLI
jgi:hypothetical protein